MAKKKQKDFQTEVKESAHKIWLAGLGALATAEEEGTKLFKALVEKGEEYESRSRKRFRLVRGTLQDARDKAGSTFEKLGDTFDDKVAGAVKRIGVPTLDEIQKLTDRVEELTRKVDSLKPRRTASTRTRKKA